MVTLAVLVGLGLVTLLAVRIGFDRQHGFSAVGDDQLSDPRWSPLDDDGDRRLTRETPEARRRIHAEIETATVQPNEAFRSVGLWLKSDRSRAFAAAMCRAAAEERALGDGGWAGRAVARMVRCVETEHLGGVVEDLGFGRLTDADSSTDGGSGPVLALLTHAVRDRLHDALRIQFGLRPFWTWETANDDGDRVLATPGPLEPGRTPARAAA